jgi:hypothetical protein
MARFFFDLAIAFFIVDALSARHEAGADDADGVSSFAKHNREK